MIDLWQYHHGWEWIVRDAHGRAWPVRGIFRARDLARRWELQGFGPVTITPAEEAA